MVVLAPAAAEEAIHKDVRRALGLLQDESPQKRDEGERLVRAMGRRVVPQVKAWIARAEVHLDRVRQLLYRLGGGSPEEEEPLSAARPFLSRHVAKAWERFHAGDYAGARRTAEAVLHLDPNSPEEWQIRRLIRQCEERLIRKEILEPTVEFRELVSGIDQDPRVLFRLVNHSRSAVGVRTERGILGMLEVSLERRYFDGSRRSDKRTIPIRTDGNEEKISLGPGGKYEREIVVPLENHKPPRGMAARVRVVGRFQPSQWGVEEKNLSRTLSLPPAECWVVASGEKTLAEVPLKKLESALFFRDIHSFFTGGQLAVWAAEDDPLFHQKLLKLLVRSLSELDETGIRVADVLLEEATGVKRNSQRDGSLEITDHWQRWYEDYCRRTAPPSGVRSPK